MIRDNDTGWTEASVDINGKPLNFAQSMTLRVAISSFLMWAACKENAEGIGQRMADNYIRLGGEIEDMLRDDTAPEQTTDLKKRSMMWQEQASIYQKQADDLREQGRRLYTRLSGIVEDIAPRIERSVSLHELADQLSNAVEGLKAKLRESENRNANQEQRIKTDEQRIKVLDAKLVDMTEHAREADRKLTDLTEQHRKVIRPLSQQEIDQRPHAHTFSKKLGGGQWQCECGSIWRDLTNGVTEDELKDIHNGNR